MTALQWFLLGMAAGMGLAFLLIGVVAYVASPKLLLPKGDSDATGPNAVVPDPRHGHRDGA